MGKREEEKRREKIRQSTETKTNLLVVQFFFETKLLLFLNCVCGSCCAIDIVSSSYSKAIKERSVFVVMLWFSREGVQRVRKKEDKIRIGTLNTRS